MDRNGWPTSIGIGGRLAAEYATRSDIFGKTHIESGYPEELSHLWEEKIKQVFETAEPCKVEFEWESAEGVVFLDWRLTPEMGENGTVISVLGVTRNITEQKQTELALIKRTTELEAALREQESFSYSVSHDLRAPLRHINSYLGILSEDFGELLPPKAHNFIERSRTASHRMGNLIDDLLELSRISRTNVVKKPVNLSELATHASDWLYESEPQRTVEFVIRDGVKARGDNPLMMQLMVNLLENAWKYTATNPAARIEFGVEVVANKKNFYVRDNGVGFDMEYSDKLFGAFQRLHGPEYEGTGIGLATAKRIVDRHGGRIWAEGKVNEGATFYFSL